MSEAKSDSTVLLSCPFCGSEMAREQRANRTEFIWMAYHPGGKNCILGGMNFDIKKWNRRQSSVKIDFALREISFLLAERNWAMLGADPQHTVKDRLKIIEQELAR